MTGNFINVHENVSKLINYGLSISSKAKYAKECENLDAFKTKRHYSQLVDIVIRLKDVKAIR
jgi:hypothetical protein